MENKNPEELLEYLCQSFLTLQTAEECRRFLQDLCTVSELQEISRRLHAANMLKNNYIYSEIANETGLSTATISRVNHCLKYGGGGYLTVLERLERKARR